MTVTNVDEAGSVKLDERAAAGRGVGQSVTASVSDTDGGAYGDCGVAVVQVDGHDHRLDGHKRRSNGFHLHASGERMRATTCVRRSPTATACG